MAFACFYDAVQALPYISEPVAELRLKPDSVSEELGLRLHAGGGLVALMLGPLQFLPFIPCGVEAPPRLAVAAPHRRGMIPVVFVHGTASSPGRWADMVNDLWSERFTRQHFEVWVF